ncbi:MAG: cytosine/adenosine deaminase-related metal-dependent hydrolase, partial [Kiritimatiellia bacterium]
MFRIFADNVVLPTSDDGVRVAPARVDIVGGLITDVLPMSRALFMADSSGVIDLGARLLAPSFTNGHTHLAMSAMRGLTGSALGGNVIEDLFYKVEQHVTSSDVRAFARMGALDCLMSGCGAVFDHYYGGLDLALGLKDVGLSGVVALTLQDRGGPGRHQWRDQLDATVALALDEDLRQAGI